MEFPESDDALDKLIEQEEKHQLRNITHEIELVAKFVNDSWNTTGNDKKLALRKLTRIFDNLKKISFRAIGPPRGIS